jgi:predicted ATPase
VHSGGARQVPVGYAVLRTCACQPAINAPGYLDNCEHLVDTYAGLVEGLLRACAGLRVLATSREGLGVVGERLYRVPSLPVPDLPALPSLEELSQIASVRLFLERAGARAAGFTLTSENAEVVAGI